MDRYRNTIGKCVYMKFTVLVITYNAIWDKLRLTLASILEQSIDDFEIVIADDGSKDNLKNQIENFFEEHQYSHYQLIMNSKNQGTVKNIISGLRVASGKYVKFISAGDLLFHQDTLKSIYQYMEEHHSGSCFGLLQGYRLKEGRFVKISFPHPFDIQSYRKNKRDRIVKNLVLYSDNVCGAAISYELNYAREYMARVQEHVRFEEDIFQVLAAVEGRGVDFLDEYVVWYEVGDGISTQKNASFEKMLQEDVDQFYRALYEKYPDIPCIKKRYQLLGLYRIHNLYLRSFLRFFVNPGAIWYVISSMVQRYMGCHNKKTELIGFLERKDFR